MGYQLVIGYNPQQETTGSAEASRYLTLDLQTNKRVSASSTVCSMPIQSGETISDHMYRNPTTVNVSGSFGILSGKRFSQDARSKISESKAIEWYDYNSRGGVDKLTNVEEIFEDIKNRGYLCTLMTMSDDETDAGSFRYSVRKNMVLRDISWEELENVVRYEFGFYEAIIVNSTDTYNMPESERKNLGLPNVKTLEGVSLSEVMNQEGDIALMVIQALLDSEIITPEFLKRIAYNRNGAYTYGTLSMVARIVSIGAGLAGAGILAAAGSSVASVAAIGSALSSTGVGLIVVAGVALVVAVGLGVAAIIRAEEAKKQYGNAWNALQEIKKLSEVDKNSNKLTEDNEKSASVLNRILETVQLQFLGFKSNVTIYAFPENKDCEALIKIGGDIYIISVSKKASYDAETDCPWKFKVELASQKPINYVRDISNIFAVTDKYTSYTYQGKANYFSGTKTISGTPPTNFGELDFLTNGWFSSNDGQYQVFLTNVGLGSYENKIDEWEDIGFEETGSTTYQRRFTKDQQNILSNLGNYQIVVCKGNMKTEYNRITNGIFDALKNYEE